MWNKILVETASNWLKVLFKVFLNLYCIQITYKCISYHLQAKIHYSKEAFLKRKKEKENKCIYLVKCLACNVTFFACTFAYDRHLDIKKITLI